MHSSVLSRRIALWAVAWLTLAVALPALAVEEEARPAPGRALARQATREHTLWITSDHSKHEVLKQAFQTPEEVTAACLTCHTEAAAQFHKTIHWTWLDPLEDPALKIGKGGLVINNF
ncbi:hypothetical protein GGQ74_001071 [Desulfobaculum xiamenense]|nr:hypothetical protein [Desulfobaculum xiamenense]